MVASKSSLIEPETTNEIKVDNSSVMKERIVTPLTFIQKKATNKLTKKLEPTIKGEVQHSSASILGLIVVGLLLMILFDGTIAAIGYLLVLIALVLILLSVLGVHEHN